MTSERRPEVYGYNARIGDRNYDARQSGPRDTDQESNSRKRFRPDTEGDDDLMLVEGPTPSQKFHSSSTPGVRRESTGVAEPGDFYSDAPNDGYEMELEGIAAWKVCI